MAALRPVWASLMTSRTPPRPRARSERSASGWGAPTGTIAATVRKAGVKSLTLTVVSPRSLVPVPDDVPLELAAVFGCAVLTGAAMTATTILDALPPSSTTEMEPR